MMDEAGVGSLRQVAANWSLAGDHKLLDILQNTHQRIIKKCKEVTEQLDSMVTSLDEASISLQNVNNRFMALSNSQFIESRVYDDDADVATETEAVKEPSKPLSLELDLETLKRGLNVLENAHESLTILNDSETDTDSEDEAAARTVLRPKDMYSDRPLPYIIGTQPWKNKWHAGLVCSDSDSDSSVSRRERSRPEYSDSEPDSPPESPPESRPRRDTADIIISETSSERHSLRDETPPPPALVTVKQTPSDMAAELARRLGGQPPKVAERTVDYEPPPPTTNKVYRPEKPAAGTVFSDEPPPLNYSSDSEDDDIFADLHKSQPYSTSRGVPDLFGFPQEQGGGRESTAHEEGDIFSDFAKPVTDTSDKQRPPLFADQRNMFPNKTQPDQTTDTVDDTKRIKKPVGAISLFGTNKGTETIGAAILKRNRKSSTSSNESGSDTPEAHRTQKTVQTKEKDIFDDFFAKSQKINKEKEKDVVKDIKVVVKTENVVKDKVDLFSDNIFDDIDDIFTTNVVKKPEKSQKSIFDDDDELFSEIAKPKTVKSIDKSSVNKKSLFDSDDDELFSVKSKSISKDTTSDSTKNSKPQEEVIKTVEIAKEVEKERIGTKISNPNEKVTIKVETTNSSTKISDIFDDDDEDMFSNTKNNKVQNKITTTRDNLPKPGSKFQSPSLFDDDDDNLFTQPAQSSKSTPKYITIDNQGKTGDILKNTSDDIFAGATKSSNLTQKDTASDEIDRVKPKENVTNENMKSNDIEDVFNIKTKNTGKVTAIDNNSASDVNTNFTINSSVIKSVIISHQSDDDDFEQDFDDLPPTSEDRIILNKSQTKTIVTETKPSDLFHNTDNLFAKPININNNCNEASIDTPEFENTTKSSSKDNTLIKKTVAEDILIKAEKSHIGTDGKEDLHKTSLTVIKASDSAKKINEVPTKADKNVDKNSETPENVTKQTERDNNSSLFKNIDTKTSVLDDIFTEPPVFEKPKEPKKSKNVNALFDDDSDDEALFFKKNEGITDERPDDFKLNQDRFDIFIDEPPDVDLDAKIGSDDELFSSLPPTPGTGNDNLHKNELIDAKTEYDSTNKAGLLKNKLDIKVSNYDLLKSQPRSGNIDFDKNKGTGIEDSDIHAPKDIKNANTNNNKGTTGNESSENIDRVNDFLKSDSDNDLFKTLTKTATKPIGNKIGSDEDLFRLPKVNKPTTILPKPEITTVGIKSDTLLDDDELFTSRPKSEKNISLLPKTKTNKSEELTSQSGDNIFDTLPKDEPETSLPKNETKAESDEKLIKTQPKNEIKLPQNTTAKQKNLESDPDESPKKVGKLKSMNFNINVNALLPGTSPKKQKTDLSSPTEQESDSKIQSTEQNSIKQSNIADFADSCIEKCDINIEHPDSKMVKSVSFDDELETGILDNKLSKERAKIQVKRRPSTRRARKEAVRKSGIDFGEDSTDNSSSIDDPPRTHRRQDKHEPKIDKNLDATKDLTRIPNVVKNTETVNEIIENTSPITHTNESTKTERQLEDAARSSSRDVNTKIVYILNDEDIFNTPIEKNPGLNTIDNIYSEKNLDTNSATNLKSADTKSTNIEVDCTRSISKSNTFESDSAKNNSKEILSSSSLKSSATKSTKSEVDSVKKSIFDSDSDGELFTTKREVKKVVKGPLFSDDDDDLFGVKKKNEPKPQASRSSVVKEPQKTTEPVFNDPLSMLGDDDY